MTATLVLLEGPSDVAALEALLRVRERPSHRYELVDMSGVTNTATHLRAAYAAAPAPRVLGLCDAAEAWVVARALRSVGVPVKSEGDLATYGFFVCDRDLEDELIRALGVGACLSLLESLGLGQRFRAFSHQQAWVGRPVEERLHRFAGIASGRKVRLAGTMAAALPAEATPPPIAGLLERLAAPVGEV